MKGKEEWEVRRDRWETQNPLQWDVTPETVSIRAGSTVWAEIWKPEPGDEWISTTGYEGVVQCAHMDTALLVAVALSGRDLDTQESLKSQIPKVLAKSLELGYPDPEKLHDSNPVPIEESCD